MLSASTVCNGRRNVDLAVKLLGEHIDEAARLTVAGLSPPQERRKPEKKAKCARRA